MSENRKKLPAKRVAERYGVCGRTLDRWLERPDLGFPRPLVVNARRYFDEGELVAWERARAADKSSEPVPPPPSYETPR